MTGEGNGFDHLLAEFGITDVSPQTREALLHYGRAMIDRYEGPVPLQHDPDGEINVEDTLAEFLRTRPRYFRRIFARHAHHLTHEIASLQREPTPTVLHDEEAEQHYREWRQERERKHEAERQERMAIRPEPTQSVEIRRCTRCNRKPARIDDYCKKCAREVGIVVHGKIGGP